MLDVMDDVLKMVSAQVTLRPSGHQFSVEGRDTLLQAGMRAGLKLNYGCGNGSCGMCKVRVIDGMVARTMHTDYVLSETEKSQGYVLACAHTAASSELTMETLEANGPADIPQQHIVDPPRPRVLAPVPIAPLRRPPRPTPVRRIDEIPNFGQRPRKSLVAQRMLTQTVLDLHHRARLTIGRPAIDLQLYAVPAGDLDRRLVHAPRACHAPPHPSSANAPHKHPPNRQAHPACRALARLGWGHDEQPGERHTSRGRGDPAVCRAHPHPVGQRR